MVKYTTKEGDVLDWICWKHYGTTDVLEQVLAVNSRATQYKLPAGIVINLPYISSIKSKKNEVHLWN